jgi:hypothetical protein
MAARKKKRRKKSMEGACCGLVGEWHKSKQF